MVLMSICTYLLIPNQPFKDCPPTIYNKWLFLWYFQRLPAYDLQQMIVHMVLSKTTRLQFTTNDCSYGTFKGCPPTIYDYWLFLRRRVAFESTIGTIICCKSYEGRFWKYYRNNLPAYDLQHMNVHMVLSKTTRLRFTTNDCSYGILKGRRAVFESTIGTIICCKS
jgi:hypothetical protein